MQAQMGEMEKIISGSQQGTGNVKSPPARGARGGQARGRGDLTSLINLIKPNSGVFTQRAHGYYLNGGTLSFLCI